MGWRFRKSFTVMPGVRLNVSRRGVSATLGVGPLSVNVGPRGTYVNANLPGTSISLRERVGGGARPAPFSGYSPTSSPPPLPTGPGASPSPDGLAPEFRLALSNVRHARETLAARAEGQSRSREIRSGSSATMTSPHLEEFRDALVVAQRERDAIARELDKARPVKQELVEKHRRWEAGWFLRRLLKKRFAVLGAQAEEAAARVAELEEQLKLSVLAAEFTIPAEEAAAFEGVVAAFEAVAGAAAIWDTTHTAATDRVRERTAASSTIKRERVRFGAGSADALASTWRVPHLENANGGDLYLYPGIVIYRVARDMFAVLEAREVSVQYETSRFIEKDPIPRDSQVVGQTWEYVNKNGTPDRRFAHNPTIPIVHYGTLTIRSRSGLYEEYMVSSDQAARQFADAWAQYAGR